MIAAHPIGPPNSTCTGFLARVLLGEEEETAGAAGEAGAFADVVSSLAAAFGVRGRRGDALARFGLAVLRRGDGLLPRLLMWA